MGVIRVSAEARAWLADRGGVVTLRLSPRHGCCGGAAGVPVAEPGPPSARGDFTRQDVDGLAVYLPVALQRTDTLTIRLDGFLGMKRLFVDGAPLSAGKER